MAITRFWGISPTIFDCVVGQVLIFERYGRWYIGTTKTKCGERQIHISPTLMKALVNFKNRQMELRLL